MIPADSHNAAGGVPAPSRSLVVALAGLLTLAAAILFYPDAFADVGFFIGPFWISPLEFVFVVAAPPVIYHTARNIGRLTFSLIDAFLLVFLAYVTVRGLVAIDSLEELGPVIAYPVYIMLFYYGTAVIGQQRWVTRILFSTVLVIGMIVIAYACIEYFLNRNILFSEITRFSVPEPPGRLHYRISSTLGHPVVLGLFIVQVAPFFVFEYARARELPRQLMWTALILFCTIALLITFTRGAGITALVIVAVVLPWSLWRYRDARLKVLLLVAAVLATLLLFTIISDEDVSSGIYSEARLEEGFSTRIYMWERTPEAIRDNPVFGVGIWNGVDTVALIRTEPEMLRHTNSIDNIYLTLIVEQGLLGFALIAGTIILLAVQAFRILRNGRPYNYWMIPVVASMAAVVINGLTFDSLMIRHNVVLFWFMAGIMRSYYEIEQRSDEEFFPG